MNLLWWRKKKEVPSWALISLRTGRTLAEGVGEPPEGLSKMYAERDTEDSLRLQAYANAIMSAWLAARVDDGIASIMKVLEETKCKSQYTPNWRTETYSIKNTHGRRPIESKGISPESKNEEGIIASYVSDFAKEFNDQASVKSSTARAVNVFRSLDISLEKFIERMYTARSITKAHLAMIRNKPNGKKSSMAYWFQCLTTPPGSIVQD